MFSAEEQREQLKERARSDDKDSEKKKKWKKANGASVYCVCLSVFCGTAVFSDCVIEDGLSVSVYVQTIIASSEMSNVLSAQSKVKKVTCCSLFYPVLFLLLTTTTTTTTSKECTAGRPTAAAAAAAGDADAVIDTGHTTSLVRKQQTSLKRNCHSI